jgi:hypothetical protein
MDSMEWVYEPKIQLNVPALLSQKLPTDKKSTSVTEELKEEKKIINLFG